MSSPLRSILISIASLIVLIGVFSFVVSRPDITAEAPQAPAQQAAGTNPQTATAIVPANGPAASTPPATQATKPAPVIKIAAPLTPKAPVTQPGPNQVTRIQNPYSFPPESPADVNEQARLALVNILCMPRGGSLSPISGSGVIIDPRGVILTNAHVAQYVLLSQDPHVNLSCTIRTGAPAAARWTASALYIPSVWVQAHASEILTAHPTGTGEHDYGLLLITGSVNGAPLPPTFPYLPYDTRDAVAFPGDNVLVASYPAEFLGGIAAQFDLFPASSFATIGQLLTFGVKEPDLVTLGGIIEAQSGSSGGAVVNGWGRLVGLIVTTSEGATTGERDLHALALSYVSRDLTVQTQSDLAALLSGDVVAQTQHFDTHTAPDLISLYLDALAKGPTR